MYLDTQSFLKKISRAQEIQINPQQNQQLQVYYILCCCTRAANRVDSKNKLHSNWTDFWNPNVELKHSSTKTRWTRILQKSQRGDYIQIFEWHLRQHIELWVQIRDNIYGLCRRRCDKRITSADFHGFMVWLVHSQYLLYSKIWLHLCWEWHSKLESQFLHHAWLVLDILVFWNDLVSNSMSEIRHNQSVMQQW